VRKDPINGSEGGEGTLARGEKRKLEGELRGACARERRPIDNVGGGSTVPMTNWEEENKAKDVKDVKDDGFMASKLSLKARRKRRIGMYTNSPKESESERLYSCIDALHYEQKGRYIYKGRTHS
jgi:hypothetical protein